MKALSGNFINCSGRYAIVAGRFNHFITDSLIAGAKDGFNRQGVGDDDIDLVWVPGAFEMPFTVKQLLNQNKYRAIITLGAVIRGATPHFDIVAGQCAAGIASLNTETDTPIIFGVLTTDTIEQAIERAGTKAGNKGADAALAALEMASLTQQLHDQ